MLDIIIPCYNEEASIPICYEEISKICAAHDIAHRFIFIDDGSADGSWAAIEQLENAVGIKFSRNFGKEAAIQAGLLAAKGDCSLIIDVDLQHPIEMIPKMYALWRDEGWDVVNFVKRRESCKSGLHKGMSRLFNGLISRSVGIDMQNASDYKLLDRRMVQVIASLPESQKFFRALVPWAGFKQTNVYYDTAKRRIGQSKWSFFSLLRYALVNIASFSSVPLQLITGFGVLFTLSSFVLGLQTLLRFLSGNAIGGFTTVILLQLITGSVLMLGIGIIGFYISMIYNEIKRRPLYLVEAEKKIAHEDK